MKASDLMIGDWVSHEGSFYRIRQLGIFSEDRDGNDFPAVCIGRDNCIGLIVGRDEIEPIPLTYEILESNFGENESKLNIDPQYLAYPKHEMIGVQLKPKPDCRKLLEVFNYDTNRGMKYECNRPDDVEYPFYVHELQHVLKLCKIEKEIKI